LNPGDYVVHVDHGIGQFGYALTSVSRRRSNWCSGTRIRSM
jgi:transcription-repair coupling factor (superfamily II helicase)